MGSSASHETKRTHPNTRPHVINLKQKPANRNAEKATTAANHHKREQEFINEALEAHNEYRNEHGVPPVVHSTALAAHARKWAEELAKRDMLMHSNRTLPDGEPVGENIYTSVSCDGIQDVKGKTVVRKWYNEVENHSFGKSEFSMKAAHFTQMIWKTTKEFGIAKARSNEGNVYVVANYRPTGNVTGQFKSNVLPVPEPNNTDDSSSESSSSSFDYYKYANVVTQRTNIDELMAMDVDIDPLNEDQDKALSIQMNGSKIQETDGSQGLETD